MNNLNYLLKKDNFLEFRQKYGEMKENVRVNLKLVKLKQFKVGSGEINDDNSYFDIFW